jgi:dihydroorotate dehydrogenase
MLTQRAINIVKYIAKRTDGNYPIIGSGGMMTPEDVAKMMEAGASLVALNSGIRENGFKLLRHSSNYLTTDKDSINAETNTKNE